MRMLLTPLAVLVLFLSPAAAAGSVRPPDPCAPAPGAGLLQRCPAPPPDPVDPCRLAPGPEPDAGCAPAEARIGVGAAERSQEGPEDGVGLLGALLLALPLAAAACAVAIARAGPAGRSGSSARP